MRLAFLGRKTRCGSALLKSGERVAARVVARQEAALEAFASEALGAVIAALVSAIINTFKTASKRVARLLREAGQSLVWAVLTFAIPAMESPPASRWSLSRTW